MKLSHITLGKITVGQLHCPSKGGNESLVIRRLEYTLDHQKGGDAPLSILRQECTFDLLNVGAQLSHQKKVGICCWQSKGGNAFLILLR